MFVCYGSMQYVSYAPIAFASITPCFEWIFGEQGSTRREVWEMRACCGYVSQTLRQARIDSGLMQEELFAKWGLKDDCGNLAHAENGNRVLPYKYLYRHLDGLSLKAVLVRPGLIDWNPISRTHTL